LPGLKLFIKSGGLIMKKIGVTLLILTCVIVANAQTSFRDIMFSAKLDTAQAHGTLIHTSSGNGMAGFSYHDDTLWFDITVNGLTGPITASHIHHGKKGVSGPVVYSLQPFINGNKIKGYLTGIVLGNGDLANFFDGEYYVNVHTASNPAGEIRGQIWPETDQNYRAVLDLAQAGNPGSTAFGLATINLCLDQTKLEVRMLVSGLSGPVIAAHLHYGRAGHPGPVIVPLTAYNSGNTFQGFVDLSTVPNPSGFLDSLNKGYVYVNVHTAMYPGGEIRGQVSVSHGFTFDTWMTSDQETGTIAPGTSPNARGLCSLSVNSLSDTISVYAQFDQLSGIILGSHFHMGLAGVAGPIVIDLSTFILGTQIEGIITPTSPEITSNISIPTFLEAMLSDNIYVNAHTALNPAGEVRGQPDRLAREGVIYSLCPGQETGSVIGAKSAYGSGFISMDRNYMNLHFGMAVAMLSSSLTGAHFHDGMAGVSGPIIFGLPTDSVISGFWNDVTFTPAIAEKFESGGIYNNFHTTLNPAGEVRGQVAAGDLCANLTGISNPGLSDQVRITTYPNPVRSQVTFLYALPRNGTVTIRVFDLLGDMINGNVTLQQSAGEHQESVELSGLPNGVYYYTFEFEGSAVKTGKLILSN